MSGRQTFTFSESEKFCLQELIVKYKLNLTATNVCTPAALKMAWVKLTEEFNSIGSNSKRTESQLKKMWDNLKTRCKNNLASEKRERTKTGGGLYKPIPGTASQPDSGIVDKALLLDASTDVEIKYVNDSDTVPSQRETLEAGFTVPIQDNDDDPQYVEIAEDREEELHNLRLQEKEWLILAAKEIYEKAKLERQAAEELLRCNTAKRQLAELINLENNNKYN